MDNIKEAGFTHELQPLVEPVVNRQLKRLIILKHLPNSSIKTPIAEMRKKGLQPEGILKINQSISTSCLGFIIRDLPPGNKKSNVKFTSQLNRTDELEIRRWTLDRFESFLEPESAEPIINPIQELITRAGTELEDLKGAIVAYGTRFNAEHQPNFPDRGYGQQTASELPFDFPTISQENGTETTFHQLNVDPESTGQSRWPQEFYRNPYVSREDMYIVVDMNSNREISKIITESLSLSNLYHGVEIASYQEVLIEELRSRIFKLFSNR